MIKYALKCSENHRFETWFGSIADFDRLSAAGLVTCPVCDSADVTKMPMAPRIGQADCADRDVVPVADTPDASPPPAPVPAKPLSTPHPAEQALRRMRDFVETNSEDVGRNFASEARAIHDGAAEGRWIRGEAKMEEAKALVEDGIPIAPLPWSSRRQN